MRMFLYRTSQESEIQLLSIASTTTVSEPVPRNTCQLLTNCNIVAVFTPLMPVSVTRPVSYQLAHNMDSTFWFICCWLILVANRLWLNRSHVSILMCTGQANASSGDGHDTRPVMHRSRISRRGRCASSPFSNFLFEDFYVGKPC